MFSSKGKTVFNDKFKVVIFMIQVVIFIWYIYLIIHLRLVHIHPILINTLLHNMIPFTENPYVSCMQKTTYCQLYI